MPQSITDHTGIPPGVAISLIIVCLITIAIVIWSGKDDDNDKGDRW